MKAIQRFWWLYRREALIALALLLAASAWLVASAYAATPEVVLVIGEPYEQMRKQSSAKIAPALPDVHWYAQVDEPAAILRFNDPQFGFKTPPAKFFTISYSQETVEGVRMSPQVDTLTLDEALKVVLDLQDQLRRKGWTQRNSKEFPAYEDNIQTRQKAKENSLGTTSWNAGGKYQLTMGLARFSDDKRPNEERYLITIAIAKPWLE